MYEAAVNAVGIAFILVGIVTLYFFVRVAMKVEAGRFEDFRRAMRLMNYREAERYVGLAGHADLARMRSASNVMIVIMLLGAALMFGPVLLAPSPKPG